MHEGHRRRMFDRLVNDSTLCDHELLEILLFYALPRVNTNEIAHSLIDSFGSLSAVFDADMDQLMQVKGVGEKTARFLYVISLIMKRALPARPSGLPQSFSYDSFSMYISNRHHNDTFEFLEFYMVNQYGQLSFCKQFTSRSTDMVSIDPSEIVSFVNAFHPMEVIVVHNHPNESCLPSKADDLFTKKLFLYLDMCKVLLKDHFIVASHGVYSYLHEGKMANIQATCNSNAVMAKL